MGCKYPKSWKNHILPAVRDVTPDNVIKIYQKMGVNLTGRVAVKVHSGEDGNQNFLRPEFLEPMIDYVDGTVVECNTAYDGARNTTEAHTKLMEKHGWSRIFDVDILLIKYINSVIFESTFLIYLFFTLTYLLHFSLNSLLLALIIM